jgi:hypothetical protein
MASIGGRRSSCGADVFSWRAADRLPAVPADRTESIVVSRDFVPLRGGLAAADPDRAVAHSPPAVKHRTICLQPRFAQARVMLKAVMYGARVFVHRSGGIHGVTSGTWE